MRFTTLPSRARLVFNTNNYFVYGKSDDCSFHKTMGTYIKKKCRHLFFGVSSTTQGSQKLLKSVIFFPTFMIHGRFSPRLERDELGGRLAEREMRQETKTWQRARLGAVPVNGDRRVTSVLVVQRARLGAVPVGGGRRVNSVLVRERFVEHRVDPKNHSHD